ncbi:MAG: aminotransferase class V-fold PLP-dependent enzyme [Candidatus Hadarchaeum sp.]|uniref:aminotransferase class V-fold PLP-dependent enzyme n=1 Tax=Candidatus Hadarchaeum sp. TaxID=2883567 RepID=UPI003D12D49D
MTKSVDEVRADIPFLRTGIIYLDNAATTPTPEPVIEAMLSYYHEFSANVGRGLHRAAKRATEEFEAAREKVARVIGAKPDEIIFTKNTTEAINLVARGLGLKRDDKVITSLFEHHSNLLPWQRLERERGVKLEVVGSSRECLLNPAEFEAAIDRNTRLITTHHVSNAIGSVQPVEEIGKLARDYGVLYLVDAAQSVGHMPVDVRKIGCDFMAAPGHKGLLGPQGTGFLYAREDKISALEPLLTGGGIVEDVDLHSARLVDPPQIFDAGTPNIPGIIGLGRACEYVMDIGIDKIAEREMELTRRMLKIAENSRVEVYGPRGLERRGGVVSFNISGLSPHEVASMLDELAKIAVRSGHHCAQPTFRHLRINGTARASVHYFNLESEVEKFVELVGEIAKELGTL